jgi:hypothetical protein
MAQNYPQASALLIVICVFAVLGVTIAVVWVNRIAYSYSKDRRIGGPLNGVVCCGYFSDIYWWSRYSYL